MLLLVQNYYKKNYKIDVYYIGYRNSIVRFFKQISWGIHETATSTFSAI